MCGYFGIVTFLNDQTTEVLQGFRDDPRAHQITAELKKRGPDSDGSSQSERHFFAHSRLAIRGDLEHAAQPFETEEGRYSCMFNGEIYAIDDFDNEVMEMLGDTEALRKDLSNRGIDGMLSRLNGMFSLAIYDKQADQLSLAVDYFGQKPLFFSRQPYGVVFGSTAKLVAVAVGCRNISTDALTEYLKYGFVPTSHAIFEGVEKVQPGHLVRFDMTGLSQMTTQATQHYNVHLDPSRSVEPPTTDGLSIALKASVERHLISDHPVGICLSGGIDSSLVARYFNDGDKKNLVAFSVDDHSGNSEILQARRFADHNGLKFVACDLTSDTIGDLFDDVMPCLDEPNSDTAILSSAALFNRARRDVKVVLTGDGGDEVFQGYNRHRLYALLSKFGAFGPRTAAAFKTVAKLASWVPGLSPQQRCILQNALCNLHSIEVFIRATLLIDEFGQTSLQDLPATQAGPHECDQSFYLPGNNLARMDRVSLYYGIESRAPFLDLDLLRYSRSLNFKDPAIQLKGLPKALHREIYAGVQKVETKFGFDTPITHFVGTDAARRWGRRGAEFAGDYTGARFVMDSCSERRKYNLIVLGQWAELL